MEEFGTNLRRLLGFHDVHAAEVAAWTDLTPSIFSKWAQGHRTVSFRSAIAVADFFGLSADRLARVKFEELVGRELADVDRFKRVEAQIARNRKRRPAVEAIRSPKEARAQEKADTAARGQKKSAGSRTRTKREV